jgi:hypothetical protein
VVDAAGHPCPSRLRSDSARTATSRELPVYVMAFVEGHVMHDAGVAEQHFDAARLV